MKIRCPDCKHRWEYKGKLKSVVCASCGKRIKLKESIQTIPLMELKGGVKDGSTKNN